MADPRQVLLILRSIMFVEMYDGVIQEHLQSINRRCFVTFAKRPQNLTVNGQGAATEGIHQDTVIISTAGKRNFQVIGRLG